MHCAEYRDLVAPHADEQLTAEETTLALAHVGTCPACAQLLDSARQLQQALRTRRLIQPTPSALREGILARLDAERQLPGLTARVGAWRSQRLPRLGLAGALAIVTIALGLLLRSQPHAPTAMLEQVVADYQAAQTEAITLALRTDDPDQLRQYYQRTGALEFTNTVMDLRPFGLELVGGTVVNLESKKSTFTLYRGAKGLVLCHRIWAPDMPLPSGGETIKGDTFYTLNGITVCIHREGGVVCFLATAMPRAEFIRSMIGHV